MAIGGLRQIVATTSGDRLPAAIARHTWDEGVQKRSLQARTCPAHHASPTNSTMKTMARSAGVIQKKRPMSYAGHGPKLQRAKWRGSGISPSPVRSTDSA